MVTLGKIIQGMGELYVSPEGFQNESKVKVHYQLSCMLQYRLKSVLAQKYQQQTPVEVI